MFRCKLLSLRRNTNEFDANRRMPFRGRTAPLRSVTAAMQLDCPACGSYEVTVGAIGQLRTDAHAKATVRAEIRRQLDGGVEMPHIDLEIIKALKGR
jgi:hypothetical protein